MEKSQKRVKRIRESEKGKLVLIDCQSQLPVSRAKQTKAYWVLPSLPACSDLPQTQVLVPKFSPLHLPIPTVCYINALEISPRAIPTCSAVCISCCCPWLVPPSGQACDFSLCSWASSTDDERLERSWEDTRTMDPTIPLAQKAKSSQWHLKAQNSRAWVSNRFPGWCVIWTSYPQIPEMFPRGELCSF